MWHHAVHGVAPGTVEVVVAAVAAVVVGAIVVDVTLEVGGGGATDAHWRQEAIRIQESAHVALRQVVEDGVSRELLVVAGGGQVRVLLMLMLESMRLFERLNVVLLSVKQDVLMAVFSTWILCIG